MYKTIKKIAMVSALAFVATLSANATIITTTLADIDGSYNTSGFPIDIGTWAFNYSIPTDAIINSATLSGTYGTDAYANSTASFDAVIDGLQLTVCDLNSSDCFINGTAYRTFSFNLSSIVFPSLLDGTADMTILQTSGSFVRFGSPALTIDFTEVAAVAEPSALALLMLGIAAMGAAKRRSRRSIG